MIKQFGSLITAIVATQIISAAWAESSDPGWLDSLRLQLLTDKNCNVQYYLNFRESPSPTGDTFSARAQCEDGRRFDAKRSGQESDFTLESCDQQVCKLNTKEDS